MAHKKHASHISHYASLFGLLFAGVIGFAVFGYNPHLQAGVGLSLAIGYTTWGVVHHMIHKDLTPGVFMEYFSASLLALAIVLSLIYWM